MTSRPPSRSISCPDGQRATWQRRIQPFSCREAIGTYPRMWGVSIQRLYDCAVSGSTYFLLRPAFLLLRKSGMRLYLSFWRRSLSTVLPAPYLSCIFTPPIPCCPASATGAHLVSKPAPKKKKKKRRK
ncbi:hypothetical protein CC78DRAFT_218967 [Lojkania enalia]|uniref:Uncharacterized protein n=1 Tax=Lojkania enalia TaxID=147567 RepID=A0A9P4KBK7_9PLEO|nr:hypothetical protein CC78DRAFT_218967 [Didymosphaeria enalia]